MKNRKTYKIIERQTKTFKCEVTEYAVSYDGDTHPWFFTESYEEAEKKLDEYNHKFYISDYSNEEIEEFYNSIPWNEFFEKLNNYLGMNLTYKITPRKHRDRQTNTETYIEGFGIISNENLAATNPILAKAWSDFRVATFNNAIACDKSTGRLYAWGSIHYEYEHLNGGSNGAELLCFTYNGIEHDNEFDIHTEQDAYKQRIEREKRWKEAE